MIVLRSGLNEGAAVAILGVGRSGRETALCMYQNEFFQQKLLFQVVKPMF